jgi:transcriptional regulator with XRE-family HTH domain
MEDARFGRIVRALRHRLELPQREVGRRAQSSQNLVSRIERGRVEAVSVGRLRRVLAVFDAELVLFVRWRGGEVDRLLDRAHAGLGERVSAILSDLGWEVVAEVSYAEFGERGSIDLLAWHAATSTLLVIEIKSELTSIEETLRRHDAKTRLAPKIASDRFGWLANAVACLLVLPDERTPRRHVERHAQLFSGSYPMRGWELRRWLAAPGAETPAGSRGGPTARRGPTGGILFLPSSDGERVGQPWRPRRRITGRRTRQAGAKSCQSSGPVDR